MLKTTTFNKVVHSVELLRKYEPLALKFSEHGYLVNFSGGKDSVLLLSLVMAAGVKFKAVYNVTTLDPPELVLFIKQKYPYVEFQHPEMSFCKLIEKKQFLPTRQNRYCCQYLKEVRGKGFVNLVGVRSSESARRMKQASVFKVQNKRKISPVQIENVSFDCVGGSDKLIMCPILDFTDKEVWEIIRVWNLLYCDLYDKGHFHR